MSQDLSQNQASDTFPPEYLPSVPEVVAVLKMCVDHDLPLNKLPKLWDDHQNLQQVERRAGIQNGNMDREIKRLRGLVSELDAQLRDRNGDAANQLELYRTRIADLEETEGQLRACIDNMQADKDKDDDITARYATRVDELEGQLECYVDKYEALLARCKHFEAIADPSRIHELEERILDYRAGIGGMKEIVTCSFFSFELRCELLRKCLYVFEPQQREAQCNG
jgi:hypothetical protein